MDSREVECLEQKHKEHGPYSIPGITQILYNILMAFKSA